MKAIIPIAGKGTRMRPLTLNHPKVLLPVAGKPMIDHIIEALWENNIQDMVFIVGFLGDEVKEYIRRKYSSINSIFVEQKEMLGLGHAIFMAEPYVNDEEVFIVLGDTLFDVDFKAMTTTKNSNLGVKRVENPSRFGVAVVKNGNIEKLVEKPTEPVSDLALVGLYYVKEGRLLMQALKRLIQNDIKTSNEYQLTDALQLLLNDGIPFTPFPVENWYDCGKPETILETSAILLKKQKYEVDAEKYNSCQIIEPVFIGENVTLSRCVIGPHVSIMNDCHLENVNLENCSIGEGTVLKNVILRDSIIGDSVMVTGKPGKQILGDFTVLE